MKILLVVSRYPWPPRRGDQLRTLQTLEGLAGSHRLTLLAPEPGPGEPAPPSAGLPPFELVTYRRRRGLGAVAGVVRAVLSGRPLQSGLFDSPDLRRGVRARIADADLVILQLVRLAACRSELGETPHVVDLIDALSLSVTRRAALDRRWLRPLLAFEARRLATEERRLIEQSRLSLVVSARDRQWLLEARGGLTAPRIQVVPLAVEEPADRRSSRQRGERPEPIGPVTASPRLVVTGNLGYFVNRDAVLWWLQEVWPELVRRRPDLRLVIAGARPSARLARAVGTAGAELLASPPDVGAVLAGATVALAPLRGGAGVPVKVLEAWALGVPVVASGWAAAGTGGRPGEDLLVAESPEQWIGAIERLLDDPDLQGRLSRAGRRRLALDHSRQCARDAWQEAVFEASGDNLSPGH